MALPTLRDRAQQWIGSRVSISTVFSIAENADWNGYLGDRALAEVKWFGVAE